LSESRHFAGHDPLGEQFGDGGFATPGSPISTGLFLLTPREHLDQAADFGLSRPITAVKQPGPGRRRWKITAVTCSKAAGSASQAQVTAPH